MVSWTVQRHKKTGLVLTGPYHFIPIDERQHYEEVAPFEFQDTMTYDTFGRGRSSAYFVFKGTKHTWYAGMDCLTSMIPHMINGVVSGTFCFRKQGDTTYVRFVKP